MVSTRQGHAAFFFPQANSEHLWGCIFEDHGITNKQLDEQKKATVNRALSTQKLALLHYSFNK